MTKSKRLNDLTQTLKESKGIPLAPNADFIIPGEGNPQAKIMLIGEAPGYHETVQHRPFVGRSGQLLRKTLVEVGHPPEEVYISNIVKARPPENRDPTPAEIAAYKPFLDKEITIIDPAIIVTLGRFSMAKFLPDVKISQVHGRLHQIKWVVEENKEIQLDSDIKNLFILPMYHPAAGLRSTKIKQSFVDDFKKLDKIMDWIEKKQESQEFKQDIVTALY